MTKKPAFAPPIADLLDEFFAEYQPNAAADLRSRITIVRSDLQHHLDLEGPRILTSDQLAILRMEKQIDPVGAFVRTMHADDLYYAFPHYLDPRHAFAEREQRVTQLDVIAALAASIWRRGLVSDRTVSECTIIEFEIALRRGREALASR